jgi:D-3-phosphoglycerate dehydrogenase / 2-oxoglutarate reductase
VRVLVADRLPDQHVDRLREDHEVTYDPGLLADDLPAAVAGAEALVVRSTRVEVACLDAADRLQVVLRAGAGTDTIDKEAAAQRGIAVCNLPGRNADAVAELAIGLMISLDRRLPEQVADLRSGRWRKGHYAKQARGIAGRSVGIVGLGRIGLAVAERAAAFRANVHAIGGRDRDEERRRRAEAIGIDLVEDLDTLADTCDVLTFHLPSTEDTRGIIGPQLLDRVHPGTMLINTSRGDLVDAPALLAALDEKELWVGLDVYPDEPAEPEAEVDSELAAHPRVHGTHHVGASTVQAQHAVAEGVIEALAAFAEGGRPNCVNEELLARAHA